MILLGLKTLKRRVISLERGRTMSILAVNAQGALPVADDPVALSDALTALPPEAPVMILLHGYGYSPSRTKVSPHRFIFSQSPEPRTHSWPRRLGFGHGAGGAQGLCIAFGWEAMGTLWRAYSEAGRAGVALAALIRQIRARHQGPLHLVGHSFGARVALAALPELQAGDVNRIILLAGAEFVMVAEAALGSPAGQTAEVLNVTSRENDLFDFALEHLFSPFAFGPRMLGIGLDLPQVVTLQIDHADHRHSLQGLGFPTDPRNRAICHWSAYTRPGLFPFYRAFLCKPAQLPLTVLRATLCHRVNPRWSALRGSGLRSLYSILRPKAQSQGA